MKLNKRDVLLHKIHIWISLAIKLSLFGIAFLEKIDVWLIVILFCSFIFFLIRGVMRTFLDLSLNDTLKSTLIFKYTCTALLSIILLYQIYFTSKNVLFILSLFYFMVEIITIFVIVYRHKILGFLKK